MSINDIEPKPCPFCKFPGKINSVGEAHCSNQICAIAYFPMKVKDWNNRPIEDDLRQQLAEKDKETEEWKTHVKLLNIALRNSSTE